ncbi:YveK family protein [Oenococcus sp.]|uniref:YveK family protein n=1 Tax=Oenococcus sp. TaxID=1979414 RepID=UPI0039E9B40A
MDNQKEYISKNIGRILKTHWKLISFSGFLVALLTMIVTTFFVTPVYQSSTDMLVNRKTNSNSIEQYNQIQTDIQLINTYKDFIRKPIILNGVRRTLIDRYQLDIPLAQLQKNVIVSSGSDSQVFTIIASNNNPRMAAAIANAVAYRFKNRINDLMSIKNVHIISKAGIPQGPIFPPKKLFIAVGLVAGVLLGSLIALLYEYFDNSVKDEKFLIEKAQLPNLGTVFNISDQVIDNNTMMANIKLDRITQESETDEPTHEKKHPKKKR